MRWTPKKEVNVGINQGVGIKKREQDLKGKSKGCSGRGRSSRYGDGGKDNKFEKVECKGLPNKLRLLFQVLLCSCPRHNCVIPHFSLKTFNSLISLLFCGELQCPPAIYCLSPLLYKHSRFVFFHLQLLDLI